MSNETGLVQGYECTVVAFIRLNSVSQGWRADDSGAALKEIDLFCIDGSQNYYNVCKPYFSSNSTENL